MRVLVCGGRDFTDRDWLFTELDSMHQTDPISVIIEGRAAGADTLACMWAVARRVSYEHYPADWKTHGRAAGPLRNAKMLSAGRPDLVLAFPGGSGTANMVKQARASGVNTKLVRR